MATAELAACRPVLMLVLAVAVTAVTVVAARVRVQDAAREAARAAARGETSVAGRLARDAAPGAQVVLTRSGSETVAVVRLIVHPLGGMLPSITVSERSVAMVEPSAASP